MSTNKPRTLLIKTRTYAPVPDKYMFPDDNKELYKSFQRFPKENSHWPFEVIEHNGKEYILESINETAFDTEERPIHEFVEDEKGIEESSTVYFEGKDGKTMCVRATSGGFVAICKHCEDTEVVDTSDMIFITKGRRNDLGAPYVDVEESEMEQWDDDFDDYNSKYDVLEKDQYGNPLKALTWVNDEMIHLRTYEYTYAK